MLNAVELNQVLSKNQVLPAGRNLIRTIREGQPSRPPMATSNSPTYGRPNSPGQDALIIS
jgi:hypothetical protein